MDSTGISDILGAVNGIAQTGIGAAQYFSGRKMAKNNVRPDYQIPDTIKQNLSQAQMTALEGLPPAAKEQYINNLQRSANFGLSAMSSRKGGLAGLGALQQNQNDAYNNLLSQDAIAHQNNQAGLMNARTQYAGFQDKQFELNKLNTYLQKQQTAQGLQGAGIQNAFGGLNTLSNTALQSSILRNQNQDGTNPTTGQPLNSQPDLGLLNFGSTNNYNR